MDSLHLDQQQQGYLLLEGFLHSCVCFQRRLSKVLNWWSMVLGYNRAIPHTLVPKLRPLYDNHYQAPCLVRLPNLPTHLCHFSVFQGIGNTLGCFLATDPSRGEKGIYTYDKICVEIDISKGFPNQIHLKDGDFLWTQTLDNENTAFRCRHCHQTGHLQNSCSTFLTQKKKRNHKSKSKSWKPCDPPSMDNIESFSSDEEETKAKVEAAKQTKDTPSSSPKGPTASSNT